MKKQFIIGVVLICVVLPFIFNFINKQFRFEGTKEGVINSMRINDAGRMQCEVSIYLHDQFQRRHYVGFYEGTDERLLSQFPQKRTFEKVLSQPKVKVHYSGNAVWCTNCVTIDSLITE